MRKIVAVERADLPEDTTAHTPSGFSDLCVEVLTPLKIILIRSLRTGIQAFLAALLGGAAGPYVPGVSDALPPSEFGEKMLAALYVGGVAALITAIWNGGELLAKVDEEHPAVRA